MAMTGYNPSQVSNSINQVKNAYKAYNDAMNTGLQNRFVKPMEDVWACEQAQSFFRNSYKPAVDQLYASVENSLASVVGTMNEAARNWAAETESDFSQINHEQIANAANVDGIKSDISGVKGIDLTSATSTVAQLQNIKAEAEAALDQARQAVAECGFVGGDQQANITASLNQIKSDANEFINTITSAIKTSIDSTVSSYGQLESRVSNSFTAK